MTTRQQRQQNYSQVEVSPEQVRDFLDRVLSTPLTLVQTPDAVLLHQFQTECLDGYCQRWPWRRDVLGRYLLGFSPTEAAEGIGEPGRNGRDWAAHYCAVAAGWLGRKARLRDEDVIESICLLVHRGHAHGGSGETQPLHATSCLGCSLRAG